MDHNKDVPSTGGEGFTKGEWVIGYGDDSHALGIFTKKMLDEGLNESPICLISPIDKISDTDKANAERIITCVNGWDKLKADHEKVNRLLHDLTPGGSEFYGNPNYCAKWIRENRDESASVYRAVIADLKKLYSRSQADNEQLQKGIKYAEKVGYETSKTNANLMADNERLSEALKMAMASLDTYGRHPLIEEQAKKALQNI